MLLKVTADVPPEPTTAVAIDSYAPGIMKYLPLHTKYQNLHKYKLLMNIEREVLAR
jgi:hypothetical protein